MTAAGRLGKRAPRYDPRTLKLARYLNAAALPAIPDATNRSSDVAAWPMYANDRIGDCTCAALGHMIQFWEAVSGQTAPGADAPLAEPDVVGAYAAITGYDPATNANDNGAVELDVLRFWQQNGVAGHRIAAYAAVNLRSHDLVKAAVYLFEGLYIGCALPASAQGQDVWDYLPATGSQAYPGSWGGHAVNVVDYNQTGPIVVTWGRTLQMTWAFWDQYCDEAYAIISPEQFTAAGKTVEGFDAAALAADLEAVTG